MSTQIVHPDAAELEAFNQGRLEDEAASTAIALHLDTCAECRGTLEGLSRGRLESLVRDVGASNKQIRPIPEQMEYFRIHGVLAEGGMGTVYLADDTRLHRKVAVKALKHSLAERPGAKDRFLREARAAAALEHDHIVPIHYVGEANGVPFLAMPLLKGISLDGYLKQEGGRLPLTTCVSIARQIATGLAAAHHCGMIHRDIKPSNIWLEPTSERSAWSYRVKILDFGLVQQSQGEDHLTQSGEILGTPAFVSPEQGRGEILDLRSDLWSLGVVLYVMTTGLRPFTGKTTMGLLTSIAVDHPPAPDQLNPVCPPALSKLIMGLLEKDPAYRPPSAEAVAEALANIVQPTETRVSNVENTPTVLIEADTLNSSIPSNEPTVRIEAAGTGATKPASPALSRYLAVATALVFLPLAWLYAGTVYRLATDQGELVIEINDKDIEVRIMQNGVVVKDESTGRKFTLRARPGEIDVLEKNGVKLTTKKFTLTRGGRETATISIQDLAEARKAAVPKVTTPPTVVTPPAVVPTPPASALDADRRAAEYALSIGGVIRIDGETQDIRAGTALPTKPFRLTSVSFYANKQVSDSGLADFDNCKHLTSIDLNYASVSDAGVAHFKDCQHLTLLFLGYTQVTDKGLENFKDCKSLTDLYLGGTRVTDAGVAHFKDCKDLTMLYLGTTQVTDEVLATFQDCKKLKQLFLGGSRVTDAGMVQVKNFKDLTLVGLSGTQVTDAGLRTLESLIHLETLNLQGSKVTAEGIARMKQTLPKCKIKSDFNP